HDVMAGGEARNQLLVERLHEACIGDGRGEAVGGEPFGGREDFAHAGAVGEDGNGAAFTQDTTFADRQRLAALGHVDAKAVTAWISGGYGAGIVGGGGGHHVLEFGLVSGRHQHHVGNG